MPKYSYILSTASGQRLEGSLIASTKESALAKLRRKGNIIISLLQNRNAGQHFWEKPHMSMEERLMFTKHMSTMIKVGINITEAFEILISQTRDKNLRKMYESIVEMINSGQTLSKSLRNYEAVFPNIFINMVATGEESGTLERVFEYLDLQMEKEYELRKKVISAFIYPAVVLGITVVMMLGIMLFIMPKVTAIFTTFKVKLPLITRVLMGTSTFLQEKWYIALAGVIFGIFAFRIVIGIKAFQPTWHRVTLALPIFGHILRSTNLARFARTLNSLLQSGIPITKGLEIVGNMIDNEPYKAIIVSAKDKIEQGGKIGDSFSGYDKLFPPLMVKMLYVGEKTGSLETATLRLAELYERDVDTMTRNLSVLLEPILLVFMGVMVGTIALSIIMPIYQLPNLIKH